MEKQKVYTQISRELYNQLLKDGIIYPKFGINCNACTDKAEKKIIEHLGYGFFFGWEDIQKVNEFKGDIKYSNDNNSKYVLLEMEVNADETEKTSYYNYSDLICAYDLMNDNDTETTPEFIQAMEEEFGKGITINQLVNFVFNIEGADLVQILFKNLNKDNIISVKNLDEIEV